MFVSVLMLFTERQIVCIFKSMSVKLAEVLFTHSISASKIKFCFCITEAKLFMFITERIAVCHVQQIHTVCTENSDSLMCKFVVIIIAH